MNSKWARRNRGIATWEDIDPKTFQFSVYVIGLTNSYRWTDEDGEYKKGDPIGKGASSTAKPSNSTSGGPAINTTSTRKRFATAFPARSITTSGFIDRENRGSQGRSIFQSGTVGGDSCRRFCGYSRAIGDASRLL